MIVIIIKVSKQSNIGLRGRFDDVSLVHNMHCLLPNLIICATLETTMLGKKKRLQIRKKAQMNAVSSLKADQWLSYKSTLTQEGPRGASLPMIIVQAASRLVLLFKVSRVKLLNCFWNNDHFSSLSASKSIMFCHYLLILRISVLPVDGDTANANPVRLSTVHALQKQKWD